jgi:hypothetical protein
MDLRSKPKQPRIEGGVIMLCKFAKCVVVLVIAIVFVIAGGYAAAQSSVSGSISGTVTDPSGAVIQGATVTITNTDRGVDVRVLTTNSTGYFTAGSLPLGTYTVKIANAGFKAETVSDLVLHAADALTVNKVLVTGNVSEVVNVHADEAQLNLASSSSEGLISGDQMNELVLNNRNYEQFLQLQPGVVYGGATDQLYVGSTAPSGSSNTVNFSVNGGRSTSNNWTIDGADNVDRGANLTLLTYPSVDAISEIKTLRGQYSAQFGRSASGQVDVVTKSGSNMFHGSAYEFFRNNILNANAWGNKLVTPFTPRPILRYNDFGETIGGPVWIPHIYNGKNKTFFFFSDETRRVVQYVSGNALVPTATEKTGDFTNAYYQPTSTTWTTGPVSVCTAYNTTTGACTAYGSKVTNISPTAQAYLKDIFGLIPTPPSAADIAANLDPHTLFATVPNVFNNNQVFVRIDQSFGQKLNVFYRYLHDTFPSLSGSGTFAATPIPGISTTITTNPGTQHMGHGTYVLSPTLLFNAGYAYSTNAILTTPIGAFTTASSKDITPTLPYTNVLGVVPTLSFTTGNPFTNLGSTGIYHDYDRNHNVFGDVTKTLGRHTFIFGATWNHYQKQENSTGGNQGGFTFTATNTGVSSVVAGLNPSTTTDLSFANFLLGDANAGFSQASNAITVNILENNLEGFVQDDWKVSPRLSLNLGVRYGYYAQPVDGFNRLGNFDPAKYNAANAPTIGTDGLICFTAPCKNSNGQGSATPNASADYYQTVNYINGLIFPSGLGVPNHASPFGSKVGQTDNANFAPRVGFSYDVYGDGKTALRGGYGWSYDESEVSYYETLVFTNPPSVVNYALSTAVLDNPAGTSATIAPSTSPALIEATPLAYHTPYVQQFSLDLQQEISPTFMIDIGYFGTHGTHLLGKVNVDEPVPNSYIGKISPTDESSSCTYSDTAVYTGPTIPAYISTACDRGLNQVRPYKGYVGIDMVESIFNSNYNGLQVKATKKFAGKSMIDANYTWSRDLTNAQADYSGGPQNAYNLNADYGRAAGDRNEVFTVDGVYELPWMKDQRGLVGHLVGGWETSGILAMNSGLPLTITESLGGTVFYGYTNPLNNQANGNEATDSAGIGIAGNTSAGFRPNQIGNPRSSYGSQIRTRQQWFYRGAFAAPLPAGLNPGGLGQVGTEKRGVVSAPGFTRVDLGLFRNFKIREGMNFQLRGEAFNVLNHTNLGAPGVASTTSSTFGVITSARDNRIMQVAGKITF